MSVPREKLVTSFVLLSLLCLLVIPSVLIKPAYAALSYPRPGEIAKNRGGALWNAWDDKEDAVPYFISLADSYGGSYESIGKSSGGKGWDIVLFKFGNPNGGIVMVDAYLHGNEYYGYQVLKSVITWLLASNDADAARILRNNYVLVVPVASYRFGRTNYNIPSWMTADDPGSDGDDCGVNLNRNFGPNWPSSSSRSNSDTYSGVSADSEAESQALINAWNIYQPRIYWNLHQGAGPMTMCTARTSQAQEDANDVRSILPSIQSELGVSRGSWSFSVSSRYGSGFSKDGAASRGSVGFLTEVMSGWDATSSKKADLESGNTFKQVKAMFIAMCQAVEGPSSSPAPPPPTPSYWTVTISSSRGGTTSPSGTVTVDVGQSLTVTANQGYGYVFDSWSLDGSVISSSRSITVSSQREGSSHTLFALFSEESVALPPPPETCTLVVSVGAGVGTTTPAVGTYEFDKGDMVWLVATPESPYVFNRWIVDGRSYYDSSVLVTMDTDHTADARFDKLKSQPRHVQFIKNLPPGETAKGHYVQIIKNLSPGETVEGHYVQIIDTASP